MGKAVEKQTKITGDQGKKQVNILRTIKQKDLEKIENEFDDNEKHLKYKEVFNELSNERIGEIYSISKKNNFNNLTFHFKISNTAPMNLLTLKVQCIFITKKMIIYQ